jgi:acyl-CoA synthetase (NDP forming)
VLGDRLAGALLDGLGPTAATGNPVDFAGGGEQDLRRFELVARLLLESGEVDAALLTGYFGGYATYGSEYETLEASVARGMSAASHSSGRPLVVHTMYPSLAAASTFREESIPVYREIESAIDSLARLVRLEATPRSGVPKLPPQASPVAAGAAGYFEARELLADGGVPFVPARRVATLDEALARATELGFPVALKAIGLLHKSDAGGVVLGIDSQEALARSFSDLTTRLSPEAYSVERMAPVAGVELIAGVRRDPRFGPIVLVGMGGLYAEVLADVAVALAPVDEPGAHELLVTLRGAPLLLGARGRPRLALDAAAAALAALSRTAAAHPEIAEIEVNPLLVTGEDALGLDARLVLVEKGDGDAR